MKPKETVFVIPTYRLRDVAATIEKYDDNFWANGHALKLMIFDDSSLVNHEKYYPLLEQTKTINDIFLVTAHLSNLKGRLPPGDYSIHVCIVCAQSWQP